MVINGLSENIHVKLNGDDLSLIQDQKGNIRISYQSSDNFIKIIPCNSNTFILEVVETEDLIRQRYIAKIIKDYELKKKYLAKEITEDYLTSTFGQEYAKDILFKLEED